MPRRTQTVSETIMGLFLTMDVNEARLLLPLLAAAHKARTTTTPAQHPPKPRAPKPPKAGASESVG